MPNIEAKKEIVQQIEQKIGAAKLVVFSDYRGLTVDEMTDLRNRLRTSGVEFRVMKNTMVEFALKNRNLEEIIPSLAGPNAVLFSEEDAVKPLKTLFDFMRQTRKMEVKIGLLDGKAITAEQVRALSELPSWEVLIAQVLGTMQAPITSLVYVLNANLTGLARAIDQIREQKAAS